MADFERPLQIWKFADVSARDNTGSDDGLVAGHVCYVESAQAYFYCTAITSGTTSNWAAVTAGSGSTLAATLASGNVTGGTDLVVSVGDSLTMAENASVPGGAPSAGTGKLWVKNDTPNVLVFTDDAGTDIELGSGGTGTLAATLTAGNMTGGSDIEIDNTDALVISSTAAAQIHGEDAATGNDLTIRGGNSSGAVGGTLSLEAGTSGGSNNGASVSVVAGDASTDGLGGGVSLSGGDALGANPGGPATVSGGDAEAGGGDQGGTASLVAGQGPSGGPVFVTGGNSNDPNGNGGNATVASGNGTGTGNGGLTTVAGGAAGPTGDGGAVVIASGRAGSTSGDAGNIELSSGLVTSGDLGVVSITNTSLQFTELVSDPGPTVGAGQGRLWVRNDTPNVLVFTDDAGTDHVLGSGSGSQTLSQVLSTGNTTGGDDISFTSGDDLIFAGSSTTISGGAGFSISGTGSSDITLDTSGGTGDIVLEPGSNALTLDYSTWPSAEGTAGQALTTDGLGSLSWTTVGGSQSLSSTLGVGNDTGGNDIIVTDGDEIVGDSTVDPGGDLVLRGGVSGISSNHGDVTIRTGNTPAANAVVHGTYRAVVPPQSNSFYQDLCTVYTFSGDTTAVNGEYMVSALSVSSGDDGAATTTSFPICASRESGTVTLRSGTLSMTQWGAGSTDSTSWKVRTVAVGDDIRIQIQTSQTGGSNVDVTWVAYWRLQENS